MATRTTEKDLKIEIAALNVRLCEDGSNYQLTWENISGYNGVSLAVFNAEGKRKPIGGSVGEVGTPKIAILAARDCYYSNCDDNYPTVKTRKTAKSILAANGINFDKECCQLSHSALNMLSTWARLTGYRKSKNSPMSTGSAFFIHLKKKVKI